MRTKELRAQRAKLITDARAIANGDNPSAEDNAKFDAMMAEADGLKAQIDRIERAADAENEGLENLRNAGRARGISADEAAESIRAHDGAFGAWLRGGARALNADQRPIFDKNFGTAMDAGAGAQGGWGLSPRAAQGVSPDTSGGYTVPVGFYGTLTEAELAYGGMIEIASLIETGTGNPLPIPTANDTSNKGVILGENTASGSSVDVPFGNVMLGAYTYSSKPILVSNQLLQDSFFDLESFLARALGTRIARIFNDHATTGDGASKPSGVVGSSVNAATLGYTAGGSTSSGSMSSVSVADMLELEHSVDPAYRGPNCRFMFADSTLKALKKLNDSLGRPLWLPGIAVREPDTFNGYQYVINQSMPAMAASAKSVAFGDFKNYFIRRVAGIQVLRLTERYADSNQTGFLVFQRFDGQLVDAGTHPIKYLQNSAT